MKKIISIIGIIVMLIFLVGLASSINAQEDIKTDAVVEQETQEVIDESITDPTLEDVGTTPDQAGYGLKLALEKVRLALTFNKAKKAEVSLRLAELRVKEARLMVAKNKLEALERAKNEYRKYLDITEKNLVRISDDSEESLQTHSSLEMELEDQEEQVNELELTILIKFKGLTEEQRQNLLNIIEEFKSENQDVEVKIKSRFDVIKTRLKAKGLTDDEIEIKVEQELARIEDKELSEEEILEKRARHQIAQAEKMYNLASRRLINSSENGNVEQKEENASRCGSAPEAPLVLCEDGFNFKGLTGRCLCDESGACSWEFKSCPGPNSESEAEDLIKITEIRSITLRLHAKAKEQLDKAKAEYDLKNYLKAIAHAHYSKRLSALTIASIHGRFWGKVEIENRFYEFEDEFGEKEFEFEEKELVRKVFSSYGLGTVLTEEEIREFKEELEKLEEEYRKKIEERVEEKVEEAEERAEERLGQAEERLDQVRRRLSGFLGENVSDDDNEDDEEENSSSGSSNLGFRSNSGSNSGY